MQISKNEEFLLAQKLNEEGKYEDALQIILDLELKEDPSLFDRLSCDLLKGSVMVMLGRYNEVLNLAERISQESQKLGKELHLVDAFILKSKALYWLRRLDDALDVIEQGERLLETLTDKSSLEIKKRVAWIVWVRCVAYWDKGELDLTLKYLEQGLELGKETGDKQIIFRCLMLYGFYYNTKGEFDRALLYINRSLEIAKIMQNQKIAAWSFANLASIYYEKGELDNSIKYIKKANKLYKQTNNKLHFSGSLQFLGSIYRQKGEINRALRYFERSLTMFEEIGDSLSICSVLDSLILLTLEKCDFKQTYFYFNRLKQINKKEKNQKLINLLYKFDKALILKKDPQVFNFTKAKNLLEQIINEEIIDFSVYIAALLELCDLLLINLQDTNDLKLLDMIQPYVNKIIEIASKNEKVHSYWLLVEIYLFQAKLELITLDLDEAQRSLITALQIAEKHGLNLLILRILNEQDELQKQFTKWESFKNSKVIIAERIELAHVDEQLVRMLRKRIHLEKITF